MRSYPKLLPLAFLCLASCNQPTSPEDAEALPAIDVPWTEQQSIVCFGTSLTYGFIWQLPIGPPEPEFGQHAASFSSSTISKAAESNPDAYPELLGATLRIKVHNQGHILATAQRALEIVGDSVFTQHPALVLLEFGANDFLQRLDTQTVEQRLGRLIDTLHSFGSKVIFISFLYPEMIASIPHDHSLANRQADAQTSLRMLRRVCMNHGIIFVEYAMRGIYWNRDLMSDGLHPNRAGYRRMQENISRALVKTFLKNGMLR